MAAITHLKSNIVGDFTGTVTGFNSQGSTVTLAATDLVRPVDWNSAHGILQTISSNTSGDTSVLSDTNIIYGGTNAVTLRASTGAGGDTLWFDAPLQFTGSRAYPRSFITGSAYSSHPPATTYWFPLDLDAPLALKNAYVAKSISIAMPAGTSSNTTQGFRHFYTHAVSFFKKKDTANSSQSLTYVTHGSAVLTLLFTHSSTSMVMSLQWNSDSAGGTTSYSTTSNATANLAAFFNGPRLLEIQMPVSTLSAGMYFIAQAHSSAASATSATATTIVSYSNLHIVEQVMPQFAFYAVTNQTNATSAHYGPYWPTPVGVANAHTSNADMAMSAISGQTVNNWWINLIGFGP